MEEKLRQISVKLDNDRYLKLKTFGLKADMSNQDILVKALDEYLKKNESNPKKVK
jgi:hypothetical protein